MTQTPPTVTRGRRWLYIAILATLPFVALALVEGAASLLLFAKELGTAAPDARLHTTWDSLLGWVSVPDLAVPDYYGPGRPLHTDHAGFRWTGARRPGATRRLICLGDSFTFGHGVGDRDSWCEHLAASDSATAAVNMGQVGYGIDQDWMWYERDGRALAPDVLLFAFVKADFNRMKAREFISVPKPRLAIRHDSLVATDVPVPRRGAVRRMLARALPKFRTLRLSELMTRLGGRGAGGAPPTRSDTAVWEIARRIFRTAATEQRARGGRFVAVLLPAESDYTGSGIRAWHDRLRADADSGRYEVVDLWDDFERLPPDSVPLLFIHESDGIRQHAEGHYSVAGNAWVAQRLRARLAR